MDIVWLIDEKCWSHVIRRTSSYLIVEYEHNGFFHREIVEQGDIMEASEMGIDYETEF